MKSTRTAALDLVKNEAALDVEERAAKRLKLAEMRAMQNRSASAFLEAVAGEQWQKDKLPKKLPRQKALEFMFGTQRLLMTMVHPQGWEYFELDAHTELTVVPWKWPRLTLAMDQGPDVVAASYYLTRHLQCNILQVWDPSHAGWNDVLKTIRGCGLWTHWLLTGLAVQCTRKPFHSHEYMEKAVEHSSAYYNVVPHPDACSLMSLVWNKIREERGWSHISHDASLKRMIWDELKHSKEHFWPKVDKVTLAKWFLMYDEAVALLPDWHTKQVLYTVICMAEGLLDKHSFEKVQDVFRKVRDSLAEKLDHPTAEHLTMVEGEAAVKSNHLHMTQALPVTLAFYYDEDCRRRTKLIAVAFAAAKKAHSDQNVRNRSQAESAAWVDAQLHGAGMQLVCETLRVLPTKKSLESAGFVYMLPLNVYNVGATHPMVTNENLYANMLADLVLTYAAARIQRQAYLWFGWLARGCGLQSKNLELRQRTCDALRMDHMAFEQMKNEATTDKFWTQVAHRSCMVLPATRQLIALMECCEWTMDPCTHADVKDVFDEARLTTTVATKPVEDAVREGKACEDDGKNKRVGAITLYNKLIESTELQQNYRWRTPPNFKTQAVAKGEQFPKACFHSNPKIFKGMMNFAEICEHKNTTPWYSTTASNVADAIGDLFTTRWCASNGWEHGEKCWIVRALCQRRVLLRRDSCEGVWLFPLCTLGDALVALRAIDTARGKVVSAGHLGTWQLLLPESGMQDLFVMNSSSLAKWEAMEVQWLSPAYQMICSRPGDVRSPVLHALEKSLPDKFMVIAAQMAFWDWRKSFLLRICESEGLDCYAAARRSQFDLCLEMCRHYLGPTWSNEDLYYTLRRRLDTERIEAKGLHHDDEALTNFPERDQVAWRDYLKREEVEEDDVREYEKRLKTFCYFGFKKDIPMWLESAPNVRQFAATEP